VLAEIAVISNSAGVVVPDGDRRMLQNQRELAIIVAVRIKA
jgi:hypothetical protein